MTTTSEHIARLEALKAETFGDLREGFFGDVISDEVTLRTPDEIETLNHAIGLYTALDTATGEHVAVLQSMCSDEELKLTSYRAPSAKVIPALQAGMAAITALAASEAKVVKLTELVKDAPHSKSTDMENEKVTRLWAFWSDFSKSWLTNIKEEPVVIMPAAYYDSLEARVSELTAELDALKADLTTYAMCASDPGRARHEGKV